VPLWSDTGLSDPNSCEGTVALRANDADPASFGVMPERQFRGTHVFSMHLNTGWSAHLMLRLGWRASMQQCLGVLRLWRRPDGMS
jgi:hypothetical protein